MMNSKTTCLAIFVIVLVALMAGIGKVESAVSCNPLQLSPCASAITSSTAPTALCCARIRQQRPCLCNYMRNPNLQKFIKSAGAKKVASACRTPYPRC